MCVNVALWIWCAVVLNPVRLFYTFALPTQLENNIAFSISVVHINDFHARFQEVAFSEGALTCKTSKCIGGFSRLYKLVTQIIQKEPNTLLLNAGDNYQGTLWYNLFKWNVTQHFLNKLPFDAMTLGNHEFDEGMDGVIGYLKSIKFPTVVSNIDASGEPRFHGLYQKSLVIVKNAVRIAIVGAVTTTVNTLADVGNLKFYNESPSVNEEADRLFKEENVDTVIVLSHCGYDVEKEMARNATRGIGLIVGAHSHSFLWSGNNPPGPDILKGNYPTVIETVDGRKVLVVQASAYTKYVGNITVFYDRNGEVVDWDGQPNLDWHLYRLISITSYRRNN